MHIVAWLIWMGGLLAVALSTRNPLYLLLAALVGQLVSQQYARWRHSPGPAWVWRFALFAIPVSAVFNALTIHIGDHPLFVIPGQLPLISGPVTLEAAAYGATNGLLLTTMMSIFSVFSSAIPASQIVRATPRAFQSLGITAGIALNFIPQMRRRLREVREAQAVRGHRVKGLRDWLPLWLPLLMGGLEQSMQLSEAMVARGFGAATGRRASMATRLVLLAGLALILGGWVWRFAVAGMATAAAPALFMGAGGVAIVVALWGMSRAAPHTTYRPAPFTFADGLCCVLSVAAAALILAPVPGLARATLAYSPYPALAVPPFDPLIGGVMLAWLSPLIAGHRLTNGR